MVTHAQIIQRLKEGNARFVADKPDGKLQDSKRRESLVGGQAPIVAILSCADSRVVPEFAFDAGLGELFTIRVAGNIADTAAIASLEYGVANLGIQAIVVMGHSACGAVTAAVGGGDFGHNINQLLAHITPAVQQAKGKEVDDVARLSVRLTSDELVARSTVIAEAVKDGTVVIIPAFYQHSSGKVDLFHDI